MQVLRFFPPLLWQGITSTQGTCHSLSGITPLTFTNWSLLWETRPTGFHPLLGLFSLSPVVLYPPPPPTPDPLTSFPPPPNFFFYADSHLSPCNSTLSAVFFLFSKVLFFLFRLNFPPPPSLLSPPDLSFSLWILITSDFSFFFSPRHQINFTILSVDTPFSAVLPFSDLPFHVLLPLTT